MGSGTTAVAYKYLGKEFIRIDNCEKYIEFAGNRIKNFMEEEPKILQELDLHKVRKTFEERKKEKNYFKRRSIKVRTN